MPIEKLQASFLAKQLHNENVKDNLNQLHAVAQQQSPKQLITTLKQWHNTSNVLAVTNTLFWFLFSVSALVSLALLFVTPYPWLWFIPISLFIFAIYKKANNTSRDQLVQQLTYWTLSDHYKIEFNKQLQNYPTQNLQHAFPLFSLGNHKNNIEETYIGRFDIYGKTYPYCVFRYHYVDKKQSTDKDGHTTYSYAHHDRWGIFIENMPIRGISISSQQKLACHLKLKWTTSDIQFNKSYQLSGTNEMLLARFFNPTRVLTLEKMLSRLKGDVYFHEQYNVMCWLFRKNMFEIEPNIPNIQTTLQLADYLQQLRLSEFEYLQQQLIPLLEKMDEF